MNEQHYNQLADKVKPKSNLLKNSLCAFLIGGLI